MSSSSIEIVIRNEPSLGETAMDNLFSRSENYLTRESYIRNEILKILNQNPEYQDSTKNY